MDDKDCPIAREDLACEELEGEAIVYDSLTGLTHRLNQSAAFVFFLCDGRTPIEDIKKLYQSAFDLDSEVANRDVHFVSENLLKSSIIVLVNP